MISCVPRLICKYVDSDAINMHERINICLYVFFHYFLMRVQLDLDLEVNIFLLISDKTVIFIEKILRHIRHLLYKIIFAVTQSIVASCLYA